MHWVITGANRGIGLALTRQLLSEGENVTVGIRTSMPIEHQNLKVLRLDTSNIVSIEQFTSQIDKPVDVLINNAGILIEERFPQVTEEGMLLSLKVNNQSALEYLQTLQSENPQYMDFDAALNELNQLAGAENQ